MYTLYCKMRIFFFFLFVLKEAFSSELCSENNITKSMDKWISSIFTIEANTQDEYQKQLGPRIGLDLFEVANHHTVDKFKYDVYEGNYFERRIYFEKIRVNEYSDISIQKNYEPVHIDWNFNENKLRLFVKKINFDVSGKLNTGNITHDAYEDFIAYVYLRNLTLIAVESGSSVESNRTKISYDISYEEFNSSFDSGERCSFQKWCKTVFPNSTEREQYTSKISPAFPSMLLENFNHNAQFHQSLERFFKYFLGPKKEMISERPNLLSKPQDFYYHIPKFDFLHFSLNRIVIRGLANLVSIKILAEKMFPRTGKVTLRIENLEGSMILNYETKDENSLEMRFQIGSLLISKMDDTRCVHVQARYCHIARAGTNTSLTTRQLEVMKSGLELAIANSLLLPVKAEKVCDQETPLDDIRTVNASDWKSAKEYYKDWVPFNDEKIAAK